MSPTIMDPALPSCRTRIQGIGEALAADRVPTGGPVEVYEAIGRHVFVRLVGAGLLPESRVLDVGCGGLRCGYWLIHFLAPDRYFGIEPNEAMLEAGRRNLLEPGLLEAKRPRFDSNKSFDFGVFGENFDFVVARSIWSHASLRQISGMLEQFMLHSSESAAFLASYVETAREDDEYRGDGFSWPAIRYREETLDRAIRAAGLRAEFQDTVQQQRWIEITRPPAS